MEAWSEDLNPVEKSVTHKLHAQICHGHTVPPALVWSLHKNIRSHNLRISWFWRDPRDISLASGNYSPKAVLKSKEWEIIISGEALTLLPWTIFLQTFATSKPGGTRSHSWWEGREVVTDTGGVGWQKTWKWALADEWECVRKRTKGKIGVAKSARQPQQNLAKKLTSKKKQE